MENYASFEKLAYRKTTYKSPQRGEVKIGISKIFQAHFMTIEHKLWSVHKTQVPQGGKNWNFEKKSIRNTTQMNICAKFCDGWIIFRYRNLVRHVFPITESQIYISLIYLHFRSEIPTKKFQVIPMEIVRETGYHITSFGRITSGIKSQNFIAATIGLHFILNFDFSPVQGPFLTFF